MTLIGLLGGRATPPSFGAASTGRGTAAGFGAALAAALPPETQLFAVAAAQVEAFAEAGAALPADGQGIDSTGAPAPATTQGATSTDVSPEDSADPADPDASALAALLLMTPVPAAPQPPVAPPPTGASVDPLFSASPTAAAATLPPAGPIAGADPTGGDLVPGTPSTTSPTIPSTTGAGSAPVPPPWAPPAAAIPAAGPLPTPAQRAPAQQTTIQQTAAQQPVVQQPTIGQPAQSAEVSSAASAVVRPPRAHGDETAPSIPATMAVGSTTVTAPPGRTERPTTVAENPPLVAQLAKPIFTLSSAAGGEHTLTVKVVPENLGPVTVRAHIGPDGLRVELFAPSDLGRESLRSILPDLRRDLADQGLPATLDLSSQNQPSDRGGDGAARERIQPERAEPHAPILGGITPADPVAGRMPAGDDSALDVIV